MSAPVEIPTGYTPGPWKVRRTIREVATAIDAQYACINGLSAWFGIARIDRPGEQEVGYTDGAYDAEVSDANARLIALAPDMAAELLALRADITSLTGSLTGEVNESARLEVENAALRADVTRLTASLAAAEGEAGRLEGAAGKAYALLWRSMTDDPAAKHARGRLLAALTAEEQRAAIAWVISEFGEMSTSELIAADMHAGVFPRRSYDPDAKAPAS